MITILLIGMSMPTTPPDAGPRVVASTRLELKRQLEDSKQSKPRLPLPPPSAEELAKSKQSRAAAPGLGGIINNGRMRRLYLPPELAGGGFSREPDPASSLSQTFKTKLFWIVSRVNNCAYCQGHQEVKLASDGVVESEIAALDGDWEEFSPAERTAFVFTRKLSLRPDAITSKDLENVKAYYNDLQVLEIAIAAAGFNAMNRWTGGLAIPQEDHREFLTPTPAKFESLRSLVAPLDPKAKAPACASPGDRGPVPNRSEIESALTACSRRVPRLAPRTDDEARKILPADRFPGAIPEWAKLLARFPKSGRDRAVLHIEAESKGKLSPTLRARIAWIAARHDRAWYALGDSRARLRRLGISDDEILAMGLPETESRFGPGERAVFDLVRKLTVDPALVEDADVEAVRKHFNDHETAEIVFQITEAAFFNRVTEIAGLRLEQ